MLVGPHSHLLINKIQAESIQDIKVHFRYFRPDWVLHKERSILPSITYRQEIHNRIWQAKIIPTLKLAHTKLLSKAFTLTQLKHHPILLYSKLLAVIFLERKYELIVPILIYSNVMDLPHKQIFKKGIILGPKREKDR